MDMSTFNIVRVVRNDKDDQNEGFFVHFMRKDNTPKKYRIWIYAVDELHAYRRFYSGEDIIIELVKIALRQQRRIS